MVEQRVAARSVEAHLLEAVEHVAQPVVELVLPARRLSHRFAVLLGLGVKQSGADADDDDGEDEGDKRQIGDVADHQDDQQRALDREGKHVARLRQDRGVAGDGGDDFGAADRLQRKQFGAADVVHQPHAKLMNDRADLGRGGDQDIVLGLDEQQQRDDEKSARPEADLALSAACAPPLIAPMIEVVLSPPWRKQRSAGRASLAFRGERAGRRT